MCTFLVQEAAEEKKVLVATKESGKGNRLFEIIQANLQPKVSKDWSFEKPDQFIKLY